MAKKKVEREEVLKKAAVAMCVKHQNNIAANSIAAIYSGMNYDTGDGGMEAGLDFWEISDVIKDQQCLLDKGDLSSLEAMLHGNAHMLNALSSMLVMRLTKAEYLQNVEVYGRLALKAQNQVRQTISTLAEIKGIKKTTFIHQTNNANNQQINNGAGENLENPANERVVNDVDTRGATEGARENQQDEALAISEDTGGQGAISTECNKARDEVGEVASVRKADSHAGKARERG